MSFAMVARRPSLQNQLQDQGLNILNAVKIVEYKYIKPKIIVQEVILIDINWR